MAVDIKISGDDLIVEVHGLLHKLLAFKGHLTIPLAHVAGITHDPQVKLEGVRVIGTGAGSWLRAGTYADQGGLTFWDVHDHDKTVVIELHDESYRRLIVEVAEPDQAVTLVRTALASRGS